MERLGPFLTDYFLRNVQPCEGRLALYDSELGSRASNCSSMQVAGFLVKYGKLTGCDVSLSRGVDLLGSLSTSALFRGVYNVPMGQVGAFDIAEVGASIIGVRDASVLINESDRIRLFEDIASLISTYASPEAPGAYLKNVDATEFDVLNGDAYAALVLCVAFEVTGDTGLATRVCDTVNHLINRYYVRNRMIWPYSERWDDTAHIGFSLAYQATIVGWGLSLLPVLPERLALKWKNTLWDAQKRIMVGLAEGVTDEHEAPRWTKDWSSIWEIDLACARWNDVKCQQYVLARLDMYVEFISKHGTSVFTDDRESIPGRTPIGSVMRKASNFAYILGFISEMELIEPNSPLS